MVNLVALIRGIRLELSASESEWIILANKRVKNLPLSGSLEGAEVLDGTSFRPLTSQEKIAFGEERDLANEILRLDSLRKACLGAITPLHAGKEAWEDKFERQRDEIEDEIDRLSDLISDREDEIEDEVSSFNDRLDDQRDALDDKISDLQDERSEGAKSRRSFFDDEISRLRNLKASLTNQKRNAFGEKSKDPELARLRKEKELLRTRKSASAAPVFPESKELAKLEETLAFLSRACVDSFVGLLDAYRRHSVHALQSERIEVRKLLKAEGDVTIVDELLTSFVPVSIDGDEYSVIIETPIVWRGGSMKTSSMSIGSITGGGTISTGTVISGNVFFW